MRRFVITVLLLLLLSACVFPQLAYAGLQALGVDVHEILVEAAK